MGLALLLIAGVVVAIAMQDSTSSSGTGGGGRPSTEPPCDLDPALLAQWAAARGWALLIVAQNEPPNLDQLALGMGEQFLSKKILVVTLDGSFWHYDTADGKPELAAAQRIDYCAYSEGDPAIVKNLRPAIHVARTNQMLGMAVEIGRRRAR